MRDENLVGSAVTDFVSAAAEGSVSIDPDAAQAALAEIGNVKAEITTLLFSGSSGIRAHVELGANPVGEAMAKKSVDRMSGSDDSLMAVMALLRDQTEQAETALKQAIANYRHTETDNAIKYQGH
ncbi:hypothetical protein [Actinokineospora enzanensis]|uniref:hypothetical protein n=1 Tax=Actinokineospora enzanensis TaxID=155975 RepID=UPI00036929B6|nr:hypothetical protein [Actinokineospora enzanensis]